MDITQKETLKFIQVSWCCGKAWRKSMNISRKHSGSYDGVMNGKHTEALPDEPNC
jgi:hypothetical protein